MMRPAPAAGNTARKITEISFSSLVLSLICGWAAALELMGSARSPGR
jgi:hypothetical protein